MYKISNVIWMYYISLLSAGIDNHGAAGQVYDKNCKTVPVLMNITNRDVFGSKFEPLRYSVNRCSGNCQSKMTCTAINRQKFNFTVVEFKLNSDNTKGGILGRTMESAEHHECGCALDDKGLRVKDECLKEWCHGRVWDGLNLKCTCSASLTCTIGTFLDQNSCKCRPMDQKSAHISLTACPNETEATAKNSSLAKLDYSRLSDCIPTPTVVSLTSYIKDISPDVKYVPSELVLDHCGGSCQNIQLRNYCRIDRTKNQTVTVKAFKYSYDDDKYKFTNNLEVNVTVHAECSCGCTNSPTDNVCNKAQKYNTKNCGCDCTNLDVKELCLHDPEWSKNHKWDKYTCDCICTDADTCGNNKDSGWQT